MNALILNCQPLKKLFFFNLLSNASALDSQMLGDGVQFSTVLWIHEMDSREEKKQWLGGK